MVDGEQGSVLMRIELRLLIDIVRARTSCVILRSSQATSYSLTSPVPVAALLTIRLQKCVLDGVNNYWSFDSNFRCKQID